MTEETQRLESGLKASTPSFNGFDIRRGVFETDNDFGTQSTSIEVTSSSTPHRSADVATHWIS
jgi:hypothetical protein